MRPEGTGRSGIAGNGSSVIRIPVSLAAVDFELFSCPDGPVDLVENGFPMGWRWSLDAIVFFATTGLLCRYRISHGNLGQKVTEFTVLCTADEWVAGLTPS